RQRVASLLHVLERRDVEVAGGDRERVLRVDRVTRRRVADTALQQDRLDVALVIGLTLRRVAACGGDEAEGTKEKAFAAQLHTSMLPRIEMKKPRSLVENAAFHVVCDDRSTSGSMRAQRAPSCGRTGSCRS